MIAYRREIDGLRAVALIPVILFHAGFRVASGGFVGVDVFFVISGYLITSIIRDEQDRGVFSLSRFYERRARRLLPALYVVMLASALVAWRYLLPTDLRDFAQSIVGVMVFASNVLFFAETDYFAAPAETKPLLHTWSLSIEEQYYLIFPLLLLLGRRLAARRLPQALLVLLLLSLGAAQLASTRAPTANFFLLPFRAWELAIGAFIALTYPAGAVPSVGPRVRELSAALGLLLILVAVAAFSKATPFPGGWALVPTIGTALLILFATPATATGRLLASRALVAVGLVSYSGYLWHQPIFAMTRLTSPIALPPSTVALLLVLTGGLTLLTWRFVERPFRQRQTVSRRALATYLACGGMPLMLFGVYGYLSEGAPARFDDRLQALLAVQSSPPFRRCMSDERAYIPPEQSCIIGDSSNVRVALLGDSHALTLAGVLDSTFAARGVGARVFSYSGCPVVPGFERRWVPTARCHEYSSATFAFLFAHPELQRVIWLARWPAYAEGAPFRNGEGGEERDGPGELWPVQRRLKDDLAPAELKRVVLDGYRSAAESLLVQHRELYVIQAIPEVGWHVPRTLATLYSRTRSLDAGAGSTSWAIQARRLHASDSLFESLGRFPNLRRIAPQTILCGTIVANRCVVHLEGAPLYFDDDHLTGHGAELLMRRLWDAGLGAALPAMSP